MDTVTRSETRSRTPRASKPKGGKATQRPKKPHTRKQDKPSRAATRAMVACVATVDLIPCESFSGYLRGVTRKQWLAYCRAGLAPKPLRLLSFKSVPLWSADSINVWLTDKYKSVLSGAEFERMQRGINGAGKPAD
jgi:hypothetical protein